MQGVGAVMFTEHGVGVSKGCVYQLLPVFARLISITHRQWYALLTTLIQIDVRKLFHYYLGYL